jgi:hypothetical protein
MSGDPWGPLGASLAAEAMEKGKRRVLIRRKFFITKEGSDLF